MCLVFGAAWAFNAPADAGRGMHAYVLPPTAATTLQELARPYTVPGPIEGGWQWSGLRIERSVARFALEGPDGRAEVVLGHPADAPGPGVVLHEGPHGRLRLGDAVPAARPAAAALARAVGAGLDRRGAALWEAAAGADEPPPALADGRARWTMAAWQTLWVALSAVLLLALGWALRRAERADAPALAALLTLAAGALALRLALATWGPGDLWMNLAAAFRDPGTDDRYGSAPPALLRLLFVVLPRDHGPIVAVNLALGSLAPPLLVLLVGRLTTPAGAPLRPRALPVVAWLSGVLLAVQPVLVRTAGEAGRQPYVDCLSLVFLGGLAVFLRGRGAAAGVALGAGAAAALLAFGARPEAPMVVAAAALLVLVHARPPGAGRRWPPRRATAAAGVVLLLGVAAVLGRQLGTPIDAGQADAARLVGGLTPDALTRALGMVVTFHPDFTAPAVSLLAGLGLALGVVRPQPLRLWALLSLLALLALVVAAIAAFTPLPSPPPPPHIASARYQSLTLVVLAVAAAVGLDALARLAGRRGGRIAHGAVVAFGLAVVAATSVHPLASVLAPRTADEEYRFLMAHARRLPADAVVQQVDVGNDLALQGLCGFMGEYMEGGREWRRWYGEPPPPGRVWVYYHGSGCASPAAPPELRERCAAALRRFGAAPLFETRIPSRPTGPERYDPGPLRIGFYAMTPAPPAATGPP